MPYSRACLCGWKVSTSLETARSTAATEFLRETKGGVRHPAAPGTLGPFRGLADELEALLPSPASSWGLSSYISILKGTKSSWLSPSAPNPQLGSLLCTQMRLAQPLARSEPFAGRGGPEGLRHPAV